MGAAMNIPPAALEAGARALCNEQRLFWPDLTKDEHDIIRGEARAAFLAMVEAWPNGNLHVPVGAGEPRKSFTLPALILPITETSTKENNNG